MNNKLKLVTDEIVRQVFGELNGILSVLCDRLNFDLASQLIVTSDDDAKNFRFSLCSREGKILSSHVINIPIESSVVNITVDSENDNLVLTLANGNTTTLPITSIIRGLATSEQLNAERQARIEEDRRLDNKITANSLALNTAKTELQAGIDAESTARENAVSELHESISAEQRARAEALDALPFFRGEDGYIYGKL